MVTALLAAVLAFLCLFSQGCLFDGKSSVEWVVDTINKNYYWGEVTEEDITSCGLENLTGNVLDIYSAYYTEEEYKAITDSNAGSKSGVGISFTYFDGIVINSVVGNSPAYQSGLRPGTMVKMAGDGTVFLSAEDFSSYIASREEGEEFTLVTDRGDYTVSRRNYTASYCFMATSSAAWNCVYTDDSLNVISDNSRVMSYLPEGAAYLSLSQFYGNAAEEMARLIAKFNASGCTSLILDLRNNGGGYVSVMQQLSWLFTANSGTDAKVAMTAKYKNGKEETYDIQKKRGFTKDSALPAGTPVYVLANRYTASAAEALLGVLISYGVTDYSHVYLSDLSQRCLDFMQESDNTVRTYGKGIMQTPFQRYTGEVLKLTTAEIFWPNGTSIHGRGLTADDGCNAVEAEWMATYDDDELRTAVQMIYGV